MLLVDVQAGIDSALRTLPELSLKAALVLAAAGAMTLALRRASAAARHLVWAAAVAGVLALPLGRFVPVSFAVLPSFLGQTHSWRADAGPSTDNPVPADYAPPAPAPRGEGPASAAAPAASAPAAAAPTIAAPIARSGPGLSWSMGAGGWARLLVALWLVGAAVLVLRLMVGMATVWWLARTGERIDDEEWTLAADRISRAFDAPSARLVRSRWTEMPMTWGVLRPVVLLPASADEWPAERREVVLRHELAHVARRDVATLAVAQLACALHWFNPLSWVALGQLRAEAEKCCDDWVLRAGTRASTYADHLLEMVRIIGRARVPAALALPMAQRSTFEGRLLAILEPGVDRNLVQGRQALLTTAGLAALVLVLGAMRPADASARAAEPIHGNASIGRTEASFESPAVRMDADAERTAAAGKETPIVDAGVLAKLPARVSAAVAAVANASGAAETREARGTAVTALVGAVRDVNVEVRQNAVRSLAALKEDPRSVQALIQALRTDQDANVRNTAAWALGQIEDRAAVPALLEAMAGDRSVEVRRTAAWALGQIEDPAAVDGLVRAMRDADADVRHTAIWALGQLESPRAVPGLIGALRDDDVEVRRQAAWALGQIESKEAVPALVAAMRDADREVRSTAIWALGQIEAPEAVPGLSTALHDGDADVRKQAVWALGQIESESAVGALSSLLQSDTDVEVRQTAAWALGQIGKQAALPALAAGLRDRSAHVRAQSAWAIGQVEPDRAPEALVAALRDEDREVRQTAAWALAQIEDPNLTAAWRTALRDADPTVKQYALRALAEQGDEAASAAIADMLRDPDPQVRAAAAAAMGGRGMHVDPRPQPRPQPRPRPRPRPEF
ncbi:MAG: HEAT repeat domain-containing protein [Longimicrobiaceae bacterium]